MSGTESQLREQYRNASDDQLLSLVQQGSSEYTDTAWALLGEEMTRRGLPPPRGAPPMQSTKTLPSATAPAQLPLRRWGEVLDTGVPEFIDEPPDHSLQAPTDEAGEPTGPNAISPPRHIARVVFSGVGGEYFRIWVVNLLLTLLTLGLYSAWAKVRKAKYFRQNTSLDGHVFDYHGKPVAILRGRLLALVLLAAYTWAFQFSNAAGLLTAATLCAIGPWLFMRAQQFSLANTSHRGLRFGFRVRLRETYSTLLPPLVLWLSPAVAAALTIDQGWLFGVFTLAIPWMHHRLKAFQRSHATYGDRHFTFTPAALRFYGVYAKGFGLVLVGGLLAGVAIGALSAAGRAIQQSVALSSVETMIYAGVVGLFIYVFAWPYQAARLQQVVWGNTRLGGISFRTEIRGAPLFRLVLKNVALTILTCGLYWPWAAIALARYRVECVRVESDASLSTLIAGVRAHLVSAAGEAAADVFGVDVGL